MGFGVYTCDRFSIKKNVLHYNSSFAKIYFPTTWKWTDTTIDNQARRDSMEDYRTNQIFLILTVIFADRAPWVKPMSAEVFVHTLLSIPCNVSNSRKRFFFVVERDVFRANNLSKISTTFDFIWFHSCLNLGTHWIGSWHKLQLGIPTNIEFTNVLTSNSGSTWPQVRTRSLKEMVLVRNYLLNHWPQM